LTVAGMGCDHCETRVAGVLKQIEGVRVDGVSASLGIVSVTYDPEKAAPGAIAATLESAGFPTQMPVAA